ncbi:MAG: phosphatidate cytidylyltransferase, partial [Selenomonadaceae bacterium]|nr:phosphatidate cytidylyltransferase [Selenomonadaceae bacterium]
MLTRIITGVIGIAAFAYVIQLGGEVFAAGGAVLALLAWFEFSRAFDQKGYNVALIIGGIL